MVVIGFFFLLGIIIGSFLNVCIARIPEGLSIVSPASRCPNCGSAIKPYDNVPVFGWLWLGGKCRACKHPISAMYPLVEFATGRALCAGLPGIRDHADRDQVVVFHLLDHRFDGDRPARADPAGPGELARAGCGFVLLAADPDSATRLPWG